MIQKYINSVTFFKFLSFYIDLGKIKPIIYTLFFNNFFMNSRNKIMIGVASFIMLSLTILPNLQADVEQESIEICR